MTMADSQMDHAALLRQNQQLNEEITRLREEVARLEQKLLFLEKHPTLAEGMKGEKLVADLLGGVLTAHTDSVDLHIGDKVLEIKNAKLSIAVKDHGTKRWAWGRIFGLSGKKKYDYLLLVGEKDPQYSQQYKYPEAPYIFFLVPFDQVDKLTMKTSGQRAIQLTSNPLKARSRASVLFTQYQLGIDELKQKFGAL